MICIGITGSIAMGKSTVAKLAAQQGYPVYNADEEVHKLYKRPDVIANITTAFPSVCTDDGMINMSALRSLAFGNHDVLDRLETILHPLIQNARRDFISKLQRQGTKRLSFYDIPLLYETSADKDMDFIICVTASVETQRQRLANRGISKDIQDFILSRQMSDAEKQRRADYVIHTDASIQDTQQDLLHVLADIKKQAHIAPA